MSADNYYVVRRHPNGGFTYVGGFASSDGPDRRARITDPEFSSLEAALAAACEEYSEYGVHVHPECEGLKCNLYSQTHGLDCDLPLGHEGDHHAVIDEAWWR